MHRAYAVVINTVDDDEQFSSTFLPPLPHLVYGYVSVLGYHTEPYSGHLREFSICAHSFHFEVDCWSADRGVLCVDCVWTVWHSV